MTPSAAGHELVDEYNAQVDDSIDADAPGTNRGARQKDNPAARPRHSQESLTGAVGVADGRFEPADHNVDDVLEYLDGADPDEFARVVRAEEAGKARKGILESRLIA